MMETEMAVSTVNLSHKDRALIYALLAGQETITGIVENFVEDIASIKYDLAGIVSEVQQLKESQMATANEIQQAVDDLKTEVQHNTDATQSVVMVVHTLVDKVAELTAQLPPSDIRDQLMALTSAVKSDADAIAEAAMSGTPAEPAPEPIPEPAPQPEPQPEPQPGP